jgi:hypothetical protein
MKNNRSKINSSILSAILKSSIPISIMAMPLIQIQSVQAFGGMASVDASQSGNTVIFQWQGSGVDFYHVRYRVKGGGETQVKTKSTSFTIKNTKPGGTYSIKVQACESHFLARSTCTQWQEKSFTTAAINDTCKQGYVWREATNTDRVCVTPAVRAETWKENADRSTMDTPDRSGNFRCKQGYVFRKADAKDEVCVTPASRDRAAEDNRQAGERHIP